MTHSPSPLIAINAKLRECNPFDKPAIVREQNVWNSSFPDISSHNSHASDAALQALKSVKNGKSALEKITSIVLTSQKGVGKTHLLSRIRRQVQVDQSALFVFAMADQYGDLDLINSAFRQTLAESLQRVSSSSLMQWQDVAARMATDALKAGNPNANVPEPVDLVAKFDMARTKSQAKGKDLVGSMEKQFRKLNKTADPYITKAILWTLSEEQAPFAAKWLAGEPITPEKATELDLPNHKKSSEQQEVNALKAVQKILNIVGLYYPIIICFDELDSLNANSQGYACPKVIADLVKSLFGIVEQEDRHQGIVILTVMMPNTWQELKSFGAGIPDRMSCYCQGKDIDLRMINGDSMVELARLWLDEFHAQYDLTPPSPTYPFSEEELRAQGKYGPSVREALQWLADNLKIDDPEPEKSPLERFEDAYKHGLTRDLGDYIDDNDTIAAALFFCFEKLLKKTVNSVTVEAVSTILPTAKGNNGSLKFKLTLNDAGKKSKVTVAVLQQPHGAALGACFRRLLNYKAFGATRGCLVRSHARKIKKSWHSRKYYQELLEKGGEWVNLTDDWLRPLMALQYIYEKQEKYQLTAEQIDEFIAEKELLTGNPLLQDILSDPRGDLVDEAVEDDGLDNLDDNSITDFSEELETLNDDTEDTTNMDELLEV